MRKLNIKDNKKRFYFNKYESSFIVYKFLKKNKLLNFYSYDLNLIDSSFINKKKFVYSRCKLVNRCVFTFRSRSVYRKFKLSRHYLRTSFSFGLINGFKKSSW